MLRTSPNRFLAFQTFNDSKSIRFCYLLMSLEGSGGWTTSDHITTVCQMDARMSVAHPILLQCVDVVSDKRIKETDCFGVMRYAYG
jgi:hypothetical protein